MPTVQRTVRPDSRFIPENAGLYSARVRWHFSRVRLPLLTFAASALLFASCASQQEKEQQRIREQNSRVVESQRMRALNYGDVGSERGAEMLIVDPDKTFNLGSGASNAARTFNTGSARVKDFQYAQKVTTQSYNGRTFWGAKQSAFSDRGFATKGARTIGNYEIPNANRQADMKTARVKGDAREANKTLATRDLPDGDRQFLGKEADRMKKHLDQNSRVGWSGDLREMTVEDLRELLNTNK